MQNKFGESKHKVYECLVTRHMMIIAGGEPELCVGGMVSERVESMDARMYYVCVSLVQNAVCTCCAYVGSVKKGLCEVTGEKN